MRKDRIIKIVMSAAFMTAMTALPAQAEEIEGETMAENVEQMNYEGELPEGEADRNQEKIETIDDGGQTESDTGQDNWQLHSNQEYGPHTNEDIVIRAELTEETQWEPEPEEAVSSYTEQDLYILAHAICGEGQSCPDDEQLYIGSVILNRTIHGAYPNTIEGVVFQKGQYACTRDGNYYREPTEANWRNAQWLLENGSILPANVVYQAGFRQGSGIYIQTRYHKYCYR